MPKKIYCSRCAEYVNGECTAFENFESRQTYSEDMSGYVRPAAVINKNNDCKWFVRKRGKK
jgi:hypothetical protein